MPRPLAGCSETLKHFNEVLQRFRIYTLSYEALQHFVEALSNLMRPWSCWCKIIYRLDAIPVTQTTVSKHWQLFMHFIRWINRPINRSATSLSHVSMLVCDKHQPLSNVMRNISSMILLTSATAFASTPKDA